MSTREETLRQLADAAVVAVIRARSGNGAFHAAEAIARGGINAIEITFTTPDAAHVIAELRKTQPDDVILGAGTVTSEAQAEAAVAAGAQFIVTPGTPPALGRAVVQTGAVTVLGALTPTEGMMVAELGGDAVKIFPASLGGPSYLKALRGPFPDLKLIPTGGVAVDNLGEWLGAGALCVGAGGELCSTQLVSSRRWDEIERRAGAFAAAVREVRPVANAPAS